MDREERIRIAAKNASARYHGEGGSWDAVVRPLVSTIVEAEEILEAQDEILIDAAKRVMGELQTERMAHQETLRGRGMAETAIVELRAQIDSLTKERDSLKGAVADLSESYHAEIQRRNEEIKTTKAEFRLASEEIARQDRMITALRDQVSSLDSIRGELGSTSEALTVALRKLQEAESAVYTLSRLLSRS